MSYRRRVKRKPAKTKHSGIAASIVRGFGSLIRLGFQVALISALLLVALVYYFTTQIPPLDEIIDGRYSGSVTFLDRNGEIFAWRGQQFESNITAENVSRHLVNAVVATEDKRFYNHWGVSPRGIVGAMVNNYKESGNPFSGAGGSTITIQVAKLLCLGKPYDPEAGTVVEYEKECRRSTVERKLKEMPYALALEWKYSKEEILTIYLNRAYLGAGTYGFGAASKRYFDIPASGLNIPQSAMLAGMLTAPSRYAPTNNLSRSQDRAATVLRLMDEQGYISSAERDDAMANPATLSRKATSDEGIFFADWLMKDQPDFLTSETSEDVIYYTTFDPAIQKIAQNGVDTVFANKVREGSKAQAAVVVMEKDGAVRAMVGGRFDEDRVEGGFNRAVDAKRQPGSSFKPFVYAAALEAGMRPWETFIDDPITIKMPNGDTWSPKNYGGGYRGAMTMQDALTRSTNTIAVELQEKAGRKRVQTVAHELGVLSELTPYPSLALGSSETNLLEMTTAYDSILNLGRRVTPYGWSQMGLKRTNEILMIHEPLLGPPVLTEKYAAWLIAMMQNVVDNGTGKRAQVSGHQIAGKTGTTTAAKDALFIGFSGRWVVGVWMGYDDNTPLNKVTGGSLPADIFKEIMTPLTQISGNVPLPKAATSAPAPAQPAPQPAPTQPAPSNQQAEDNAEIDNLINLLGN